jgi:hypothetical protein
MTYGIDVPADKVTMFADITKRMAEVYAAKNHDYGNSFSKSIEEFGLVAAAVRMNDKMERIKALVKAQESNRCVKDETIEDTLLDLANYAVMTLVELKS